MKDHVLDAMGRLLKPPSSYESLDARDADIRTVERHTRHNIAEMHVQAHRDAVEAINRQVKLYARRCRDKNDADTLVYLTKVRQPQLLAAVLREMKRLNRVPRRSARPALQR